MSLRTDSDGETVTYRAEYDWSEVAPSTAVIEVIAEALGRPSTRIDPLYGSIDPDSLDALVGPMAVPRNGVEVSFAHEGLRLSVRRDGEITARPFDPVASDGI